MIIRNLDFLGSGFRPSKTHSILIVDTDGKSAFPVTLQGFEPVPRRNTQIFQASGNLELPDLAPGDRFDRLEAFHATSPGQGSRLGGFE